MNSFTIEDLSFTYPEQEKAALCHIDLDIPVGAFFVLCGPSGSGKSTLLRQLKPTLAPHGVKKGTILFEGRTLEIMDQRAQSEKIGFVLQSPENQLVTDKVWHELAFGLESLGLDTPSIRRRTAEMASFFGIQDWFYEDVANLSGGQKQLLNLAAVMVMQPRVLILDEPTSQLDPIASSDFLAALGRINRELGTTVVLSEHRLEEALPLATHGAVLEGGRLLCTGTPGEVGEKLKAGDSAMFRAMPTPMRVWAAVDGSGPCPVTVRDGRAWLEQYALSHTLHPLPEEPERAYPGGVVLKAENVWFRYEREGEDVVRGLELQLRRGEFLTLLGGNGTGKTTGLKLLSGLLEPCRGDVCRRGRVAMLPQDPRTIFVKKTLREDLREVWGGRASDTTHQTDALTQAVGLCRLEGLLERHPYDLSGGEQQRAALAKVLLTEPEVLLLDEPTKGLDAACKEDFAAILQRLLEQGVSVLMVSHDIEFCARYAHRCALFFDGAVVTEGPPRAFFAGSSFYTTAANRMARELLAQAVTAEDVTAACGGMVTPVPAEGEKAPAPFSFSDSKPGRQALPWWRKLTAAVSGATAAAFFFRALQDTDLPSIAPQAGTLWNTGTLWRCGALLLALFVFGLSISRRSPRRLCPSTPKKRGLSRRTAAAAVLILLLIPLTLFLGERYLGGRKYYFISLLILLECMAPFFLLFESRRPQARELVIIAVLCALGVAGRAALFMLPQFKPVMAIAIVAGVAFGGETGFLVGAMTMLASNVLFAQGPWTPWQMFAMGLVGFGAGVLFQNGWFRRSRGALCVYGILSAMLIYGGIMNPASGLMWVHTLDWKILLTYYISGFPMDCIQAAATGLFLWFAGEPMLEKLERIKVKYGLVA